MGAVASDLDQMLRDYFAGIDSCEEIRIVRLVQKTIQDVKAAENYYNGEPGDLLYKATQELYDFAKLYKELRESSLLARYAEQIAAYQWPRLTEVQRKDVYDTLDRYIQEFGAGGSKTPEETVLIYIYLYGE